jgi:hypothetical protein
MQRVYRLCTGNVTAYWAQDRGRIESSEDAIHPQPNGFCENACRQMRAENMLD